MIFVVCIIMLNIAYLSYSTAKLRLLSPTFLTSLVLGAFSGIYCAFFNYIISDISIKTALLLIIYILTIAIGEYVGNRIIIHKKTLIRRKYPFYENNADGCDMRVLPLVSIILFVFMLYAAKSRYDHLVSFTRQLGNTLSGIGNVLTFARPYVTGVKDSKGVVLDINTNVVSVIYYLSIPITYFFIYCFVSKSIKSKHREYHLLLPAVGYILMGITTTTRVFIIDIFVVFVSAFCVCAYKYSRSKPVKFKYVLYILFMPIAFFGFGTILNKYGESTNVIESIIGYSSAGIFGLDQFICNPWKPNVIWGAKTLKPIYDIIKINTSSTLSPAFVMMKSGSGSNIYSSFVYPIQDFGVIGMLFVRFLITIIYTQLCGHFFKRSILDSTGLILFYFINKNIGAYIYTPIADRFCTIYFELREIAIVILGSIIVCKSMAFFGSDSKKLMETETESEKQNNYVAIGIGEQIKNYDFDN